MAELHQKPSSPTLAKKPSSIFLSEKSESSESPQKKKEMKKRKEQPQQNKASEDKFLGRGRLNSLIVQGQHIQSLRKVAIKIIQKQNLTTGEIEGVRDMIAMYRSIHHPNVISLEDFFESKENFFICL